MSKETDKPYLKLLSNKILDKLTARRDPDLINAEVAMKRAAIKARKFAQISSTMVVTIKNGVINEEYPNHNN